MGIEKKNNLAKFEFNYTMVQEFFYIKTCKSIVYIKELLIIQDLRILKQYLEKCLLK